MEFKLPTDFSGVRIFSSEKSDGSMDKEGIEKNLPKFLKKIRFALKALSSSTLKSPQTAPTVAYSEQVHRNKIKLIKNPGYYKGCDGLVTGERVILAVKSADCIPLLFFDNERGMFGVIHVGRRSLLGGIISVSLREYFKKSSHSPALVTFFIGPHIRKDNYEIKGNVVDEVKESGFEKFLDHSPAKITFDLTGALMSELEKLGVKRDNIYDCAADTFTDERFFSYRRGDRELFVTLIVPK